MVCCNFFLYRSIWEVVYWRYYSECSQISWLDNWSISFSSRTILLSLSLIDTASFTEANWATPCFVQISSGKGTRFLTVELQSYERAEYACLCLTQNLLYFDSIYNQFFSLLPRLVHALMQKNLYYNSFDSSSAFCVKPPLAARKLGPFLQTTLYFAFSILFVNEISIDITQYLSFQFL